MWERIACQQLRGGGVGGVGYRGRDNFSLILFHELHLLELDKMDEQNLTWTVSCIPSPFGLAKMDVHFGVYTDQPQREKHKQMIDTDRHPSMTSFISMSSLVKAEWSRRRLVVFPRQFRHSFICCGNMHRPTGVASVFSMYRYNGGGGLFCQGVWADCLCQGIHMDPRVSQQNTAL